MSAGYVLGNEVQLSKLADNQKNNKSWLLVYIRRGRGMYIVEGDLRALNEGDLFLLSPALNYSFATEDLGDEYNVNLSASFLRFDKSWLDALLNVFPMLSELVLKVREVSGAYAVKGPKWIRISSLLDELDMCDRQDQPLKIFALLGLISTPDDMALIKSPARQNVQEVSARKDRIDRYIECNYCKRLSLEEIAKYVGMSRIYFCNFFKMQYGEGFADYITRLRVEKAAVLLANTNKTLEAVAQECGFKTVQYFTRAFKKIKQITPGAFRKAH